MRTTCLSRTVLPALIAACLFPASVAAASAEIASDRLIVRFKDEAGHAKSLPDRAAMAARLSARGGQLMRPLRVMGDGAHVMALLRRLDGGESQALVRRLAGDAEIADVAIDRIFLPATQPTDPLYASQWALYGPQGMDAPGAWQRSTGSPNLVIGIVDTGRLPHADLAGRWVGGYDFVSLSARENDGAPGREADPSDPGDWVTAAENAAGPLQSCPITNSQWHGTAMAGVIAANANNGIGIAGLNWSSALLPVRVVGKCGGYESDIADGIRWAVGIAVPGAPANAYPADILNVSLSAAGACSTALQSAINEVVAAGVPMVVAAGNNSLAATGYSPGNCSGVIAVGATDRNGGKPAYANFGPPIALAAPGGIGTTSTDAVLTTQNQGTTTPSPDNSYFAAVDGTSIAAAQVTGIASLMLSLNPTLAPPSVRDILQNTARPFPTGTTALGSQADCTVALCGGGIANAAGAVAAAMAWGMTSPKVIAPRFFLRGDGVLFGSGSGSYGQLGRGFNDFATYPIAIPGLAGIVDAASGSQHSLAIRADGTLWAFGRNDNGQLGDGTQADRGIVTQVPGLLGVTRAAAGLDFSLALRGNGTVWSWGANGAGQLGNGGSSMALSPQQVPAIANVTAIVAQGQLALAIRSDGSLWGWGAMPAAGTMSIPTRIGTASDVIQAAAGDAHFIFLRGNGSVWAAGDNSSNQLGDGTYVASSAPIEVTALGGGVIAISASGRTSYALKTDGTVWYWGGTGVNGDTDTTPHPVPLLHGVAAISGGHALKPDGTVVPIGGAPILQDGTSAFTLGALDPSTFAPQTDVATNSVRTSNAIRIPGILAGSIATVDGGGLSVGCNGTFQSAPASMGPSDLVCVRQTSSSAFATTTVATLSVAGVSRNFAVTTTDADLTPDYFYFHPKGSVATGSVHVSNAISVGGLNGNAPISVSGGGYSIGCNGSFTAQPSTIASGQAVCLQLAASSSPNVATYATLTVGTRSAEFAVITADPSFATPARIDGGFWHAIANGSDGRLYAWGLNSGGQFGNATTSDNEYADWVPQLVPTLSGVVAVAATSYRSLAVRSDGTLWQWGNNVTSPQRVAGLAGVTAVAAADGFTLALRNDGTVWAWGGNAQGTLGDGTHVPRLAPQQIPTLSGVIAIAAPPSASFAAALRNDGTVWAWGIAPGGTSLTPFQVGGFASIVAIAASNFTIYGIKSDGTLWARATSNACSELGDGTTNNYATATQVPGISAVASIAAGRYNAFAVTSGGTPYGWGCNGYGAVGTSSNGFPTLISGLTGVARAAAGEATTFAIKADGSIWSWGWNYAAGLGPVPSRTTPYQVLGVGGSGYLNLGTLSTDQFITQTDLALGGVATSNAVVISGVAAGTAISTTATYGLSVGCTGTFVPSSTISSGQTVCLRQAASSSCGTTLTATLTVTGQATRNFSVTSVACDTVPDAFAIPPALDVPASSLVVSGGVVINGLNSPTQISVSGGDYSMSCNTTFTTAPGTIYPNQYFCVRVLSSATAGGVASARITIGGVTATFSAVTTMPAGFATPMAISAGAATSHAVRTDGVVFGFGDNILGQVGTTGGTGIVRALNGITGVTQVSGTNHILALRFDGTVWAWGWNGNGAVGDGTYVNRQYPVHAYGVTNVIQVAAGNSNSLALRSDGTVWGWGALSSGNTPAPIAGLSAITQVSSDTTNSSELPYSMARKSDGTAWIWGYPPLQPYTATPAALAGVSDAIAVSAGDSHYLVIRAGGTVWAAGRNSGGQLGNGTNVDSATLVQVQGLTGVVAVSANYNHSLALKGDGTVWAWGINEYGQLGIGRSESSNVPVQVLLRDVVKISTGMRYSLAVTADGTVWGWGIGTSTQLGTYNNNQFYYYSPVPAVSPGGNEPLSLQKFDTRPDPFAFLPTFDVPPSSLATSAPVVVSGLGAGIAAPIAVSGGEYSLNGGSFSAAAGTIANGQSLRVRVAAAASTSATTSATVSIGGASGISSTYLARTRSDAATSKVAPRVAAGDSHTYLLAPGGTVSASGYNGNGQLGNGTLLGLSALRPVAGLSGLVAVASGAFHGLALRASGTVAAWGSNASGQLGHGSPRNFEPYPVDIAGLPGIVGVGAGQGHSIALKGDGTVWAWGLNAEGQLGDGTGVATRSAPVQVPGLNGIVAIAAGARHTLALRADGAVLAWGANEAGQLGDNTTTRRNAPVPVSGLANVVAIAAGSAHSLAIRADGSVVAWGFNAFGQLGDGTTTNRLFPVLAIGLGSGVGLIAAGANHSLAVKAGGALYAWGNNANSQVGNGNNANQLTPVLLASPTGVVAIAGGARHSAAIDATRKLRLWGDNFFGQVGNRSGNYNPHSASLNVLRGDSVISTSAGGTGSSVGTGSNSGSSVLLIDGLGTGFDFGTRAAGSSIAIAGKYANQSADEPINDVTIGTSGDGFTLGGTDCPGTLEPLTECGFTVSFTPGTASAYYGELVVSSSVVGSPERRGLLGSGMPTAAPAVTFDSGGVDFVPQELGVMQTAILGVTNSGSAPLTGNDPVGSTLGDFSAIHNCYNIAPGASCQVQVRFTPQAVGARVAQLSFASNASGAPHAVAVSGTGVAGTAAPIAYTLAVAKAGAGTGTVVSNPAGISCGAICSANFTSATSVALTATPASGSTFAGWSGACSGVNACNVTMDAVRNVTATFNAFVPVPSPRAQDFNGDGRSDLLYYNNVTGQVWRFLVNGFTLASGAMVHVEPDTSWRIVSDADFNGDGRNDLLWRNANSGQVYLMTMGASGLPNESRLIYTEPNPAWKIVHTPDFDGDGKADLLWWNSTTGQVYVMLVDGFAAKAQGLVYAEPNTAWKIVVVGDFSGSGKKNQLIWRNSSTGQVYLMTINYSGGAITQTGQMIYQEPNTAWNIIGSNDFNGDGKSDLLWRNEATGQVYLMLMNGGTIASQGMIYAEPNLAWKIVAQGDYDGDGKADLLWRNESSGHVYMMLMNGLSIAGAAMVYYEPNTSWKVMGPAAYAQ